MTRAKNTIEKLVANASGYQFEELEDAVAHFDSRLMKLDEVQSAMELETPDESIDAGD